MPCTEWSRLINQYYAASKTYTETVIAAGGLEGNDFDRARQRAAEMGGAGQQTVAKNLKDNPR